MSSISNFSMQYAAASVKSQDSSDTLARGELNLDKTSRGRALAEDVSRVRTSTQVKNSVLSSVNLVRANLAQALATARTVRSMQEEKIGLVAQQMANINSGLGIATALSAQYDRLVDDQYHAALDLKTQDGERLVGANDRARTVILDGETKAYNLQQFRIDIMTANTKAVRDALIEAAAVGVTITDANAAGFAVVGPALANTYIDEVAVVIRNSSELHFKLIEAELDKLLANVYPVGGSAHNAQHLAAANALKLAIQPGAAITGVVADGTTRDQANDVITAIQTALSGPGFDIVQLAALNTALTNANQDLPVWVQNAVKATGGGVSLNVANMSAPIVNNVLDRQLAAYGDIVALRSGGADATDIHNVLTITAIAPTANTAEARAAAEALTRDRVSLTLKADKEIMADIDTKIAKLSSEMASMGIVLGNYEDAVSDLDSLDAELVQVNMLDLNKQVAEAQRQILIAAQLSAKDQKNADSTIDSIVRG